MPKRSINPHPIDKNISISMSQNDLSLLDKYCDKIKKKRSWVVRQALGRYLITKPEKETN